MSDSQETRPLLDLSELRLMPKWVSDFGKTSSSSSPDQEEHSDRPQRPSRDGRDRDRRGGPRDQRGAGPRGDQRGGPRDQRGGPRGDQRSGPRGPREGGAGGQARSRDGRPPRPQDGRGPRDRDRRDFQDRRPAFEAPPRPPEGLTAEIDPEAKAVEAMSAMIRNAGKAYSVFDAARLVLSSGDRYHVKFAFPKESEARLYAIPADGSLWLSREEAIEHFLASDGVKEFYRMEEVQLEAPKGNFSSIAICGLSGELLGPPSHHSYQAALHRIHRERFSHMSFEDYKRRVRTDNTPEAVEKWKDAQTHGVVWIPITGDDAVKVQEAAPAPAVAEEETAEAEAAATAASDEAAVVETAEAPEAVAETAESAAAEEEAAEEETPSSAGDSQGGLRLNSRAEMHAHFRANFAATLVHETSARYVAGNIPRQNLHPALYHQLRRAVDETRKHLLALAQRLCNGFEQHGLKLFKRRGGKLWVSRTRPRLLDSTVVLSERISQMMEIVKTKPGISTRELIEAVAPHAAPAPAETVEGAETVESAAPAPVAEGQTAAETAAQVQALKDLHWLNSEGYVIEYADGVVFPGVTEPPPPKPKVEKPRPEAVDQATGEETPEAEPAGTASPAAGQSVEAAPESPEAEETPPSATTEPASTPAETAPVEAAAPAPAAEPQTAVEAEAEAPSEADTSEDTESSSEKDTVPTQAS